MKSVKRGKAAGKEGATIEMMGAAGGMTLKNIIDVANKANQSGQITELMRKSVFIAIPKANCTLDCEKHLTISIMSKITTNEYYAESIARKK